MKTNTYGIKMTGLKAVSGDTKSLGGYYSGKYVELFFDRKTSAVWTVYQYSLGQNAWTVYNDDNVVKIGNFSAPATMQEIADAIAFRLAEVV